VHDPDGIASLQYSLNGSAWRALSIGPDNRRLEAPGDFNIELNYAEVAQGFNEVRIRATDTLGKVSEKLVTVDDRSGSVWPLPYTADWSSAANINDIAQVVDGHWTLGNGTVRPVVLGYDRLIAIGDVTWANYQVTGSITVHSIDPAGYSPPSNGLGVAIALRWQGHVNWTNSQPNIGYWPLGTLAWYKWRPDGSEYFTLEGNRSNKVSRDTSGLRLILGSTYTFKVRVQTQPDGLHLYQFKVWLAAQPEPPNWLLQITNGNLADDPTHGSMLLIAHHVDAAFENISIEPLP
jgi:hypothetical protein